MKKIKLVGGMLFSVYEDYLFYSSSVRVSDVEKDKKRNIHHFLMWTSIVELKKRYKFLELGTFYKISDENDKLKEWSLLEEKFNKFKLGFSPDIIKTIYFYKKFKMKQIDIKKFIILKNKIFPLNRSLTGDGNRKTLN